MNSTIDLVAAEELDCPEYDESGEVLIKKFSFWVEGITLCITAFFGLIGNSISAIILSRKRMRNCFNILLIALAVYDNIYLIGAILESFR